ncbi:hypothetical protein PanWU01x14_225810, partial [Parasponia andersonii]
MACKCGIKASTEMKDKDLFKERSQSRSRKNIYRPISNLPVKFTVMPVQNAFSVLRKDLAAEGKADEVLGDNHVDTFSVDQTVCLDSPGNLSNKTIDLFAKLVFGKKEGDDNNINIASNPISKKERSFLISDVSDDS